MSFSWGPSDHLSLCPLIPLSPVCNSVQLHSSFCMLYLSVREFPLVGKMLYSFIFLVVSVIFKES
jgi:ABC-type polysaccharide/polyol phosphate export permease